MTLILLRPRLRRRNRSPLAAAATLIEAPKATLPANTSFSLVTGYLVIDSLYHPGPPSNRNSAATYSPTTWGEFQTALNNSAGDTDPVIQLPTGTTWDVTTTVNIPARTGSGHCVIRSGTLSGIPSSLDYTTSASRATSAHAGNMLTIRNTQAGLTKLLELQPNAKRYWIEGVKVTTNANLGRCIDYPTRSWTTAELPDEIAIVHCVFDGPTAYNCSRAIVCDFKNSLIACNSVYGFLVPISGDSQAIAMLGMGRKVDVLGNYLEGGHENFMIGGGDSFVDGVGFSSEDVRFAFNHCKKPAVWYPTAVKNLFELKKGHRVAAWANIFDGLWAGGQNGVAWKLKNTHQDGGQANQVLKHITMRHNLIRNAEAVLSIVGAEQNALDECASWLDISYNLAYDIGTTYPSSSLLVGSISGRPGSGIAPTEYHEYHNTWDVAAASLTSRVLDNAASGDRWSNVHIRDNAYSDHGYGHKAGGTAAGTASMDVAWNNYSYTRNQHWRAGGNPGTYPSGNFWSDTTSAADVFENPGALDYRLKATAPGKGLGLNGTDPGYDHASLWSLIANVV